MKNLSFCFLSIIVLLSCGNSKEDRVKELIAEEVKKTLILPDSYDPIETKIDSAFSPIDDPHIIKWCMANDDIAEEIITYEKQKELAKSSMSIWSDRFSEYEKYEYSKAKKEYKEATQIIKEDSIKLWDMFKEAAKNANKEKLFVGYKVLHSYRAKDNSQEIQINEAIIFIDKDMQKVHAIMPKESFAYHTYITLIESYKNNVNDQ